MKSYLLRVAATNFDHYLGDTEMLPVIRGGSLILSKGIDIAKKAAADCMLRKREGGIWSPLPLDQREKKPRKKEDRPDEYGKVGLFTVTEGGSEGVFHFKAPDDTQAYEVLSAVRRALASPPEPLGALRHATFVADVVRGGDKSKQFSRRMAAGVAANRWRQMQAPSVAMPEPVENAESCSRNLVRPAGQEHRLDKQSLSPSVFDRREYGKEMKRTFYKDALARDWPGSYSNSFSELAADPARGSFDGKLAVLYLDGNGFGALKRGFDSTKQHRELDAALENLRTEAFGTLLDTAEKTPGMKEASGALRIEILVWGGDDFVLVVPGWAGLWAVATIYGTADKWTLEKKPKKKPKKKPLHVGCGLVLCHHHAPIHRIRELAEELAEWSKRSNRNRNLITYEVLESFDDVGDDLDTYREARRPVGFETKDLALDPLQLGKAMAAYAELRYVLPRRKVRAAAVAAKQNAASALTKAAKEVRAALDARQTDSLSTLLWCLGSFASVEHDGTKSEILESVERLGWYHLGQLGDYLQPLEEAADA